MEKARAFLELSRGIRRKRKKSGSVTFLGRPFLVVAAHVVPGLWCGGGYIYLDMSEHTRGVVFNTTFPEVAVDMSRYCAENCGDSAVAVDQHHRRLPCCGAEANPLLDSPVVVHLVVDVPVVFFSIPVVAQRTFPMVQTALRTFHGPGDHGDSPVSLRQDGHVPVVHVERVPQV